MTGPRMAMSADFLTAFAKLPSRQQRQVRTMIGRFERDSRASGLNYEKIAGAMDPNMRSIRIDGSYRPSKSGFSRRANAAAPRSLSAVA